MNEIVDYAVIDRRLKFLEEQARINKDFREYVMKRFPVKQPSHESATSIPAEKDTVTK